MSADLLDLEPDSKGYDLALTMNARGYLFITSTGPEKSEGEIDVTTYTLSPTPEGFAKAERLAQELLAWVKHVKET